MTTKTAYETGLEKFNRTNKAVNLLFNLIFIILALLCVIPVVVVLSISFSSEDSIRETGYHLLPVALSADAYVYIVKQGTMILRALGVSALVTVAGTVLGVLLTTSMGYVLSRPTYKLRGFLTWVVFIPMVFNGGLVSSYFINTNLLGLKDSIWALILPLAVSSFNVIICKTFFKSTIPDGLIESAEIDGASRCESSSPSSCRSRCRSSQRSDCFSALVTGTTGSNRCCISTTRTSILCKHCLTA